MERDEILNEIWKHREEYAAKFNFDIHAMGADIIARQEKLKAEGFVFATPPRKRRPKRVTTKSDSVTYIMQVG